jgi:hypothetical protein
MAEGERLQPHVMGRIELEPSPREVCHE